MADELKSYLEFEAEFTQNELSAFESSQSLPDRLVVLSKRLEAKAAWEEKGNSVPEGVTFRE